MSWFMYVALFALLLAGGFRLNERKVPCSDGSSRLHPHIGLLSCTKEYSLSNITLQHTDR